MSRNADPGAGRRAQRGRANRTRGRWAERWAGWWLRAAGYSLVARNTRTPVGEIDLIVRRGRILAFVEVKARPTLAAGLDAILPRQQARILRAGQWFLNQHPALRDLDQRYDVVVVNGWRRPRHLVDAWGMNAR